MHVSTCDCHKKNTVLRKSCTGTVHHCMKFYPTISPYPWSLAESLPYGILYILESLNPWNHEFMKSMDPWFSGIHDLMESLNLGNPSIPLNSWTHGFNDTIESMTLWNPWSMLAIILEILAHVESPNVHDWLHVKACWSYALPELLFSNHYWTQISNKLQIWYNLREKNWITRLMVSSKTILKIILSDSVIIKEGWFVSWT